jgi:hypothetical protein
VNSVNKKRRTDQKRPHELRERSQALDNNEMHMVVHETERAQNRVGLLKRALQVIAQARFDRIRIKQPFPECNLGDQVERYAGHVWTQGSWHA